MKSFVKEQKRIRHVVCPLIHLAKYLRPVAYEGSSSLSTIGHHIS